MVTDPHSGSRWLTPFAYFDRDTSSWRTCQHSLLEESGEFCTTWPKQVMWDSAFAYELPMSELLTAARGFSSSQGLPTPTSRDWKGRNQRDDPSCLPGAVGALLPTPMAYESTPTEEMVEEIREAIDPDDPDHRLWLEGRKWFTQRTLSRIAPALLPTPSANDSTGPEKETREARQEEGSTGGPSLRDLPKLLPTPMGNQGRASKTYIPGGDKMSDRSLPTVARAAGEGKLLPTPNTRDHHAQGAGHNPKAHSSGLSTVIQKGKLLPTPTKADGENSSEQRFAHYAHGTDNPTLLGAARRITGTLKHSEDPSKLLPTPTAQAAKHGSTEDLTANGHGFNLWDVPHQLPTGESTETPSGAGSSSPDLHPDQLTIGDA